MKSSKAATMVMLLAAIAMASDVAWARGRGGRSGGGHSASHSGAHHHHQRSGVFVGGAVFAPAVWPWWTYAPYSATEGPVYYIERGDAAAGEWLYCASTGTYYPYVAECAGGWQRVTPPPPPAG